MAEETRLYAFAIKITDGAYGIIHNVGIPVHATIAEAEKDFRMFASDTDQTNLEHVVINIGPLVDAGIIRPTKLIGYSKAVMKKD